MSIKVYLYDKRTGLFSHIMGGHPLLATEYNDGNLDFTLTPPPDYDHVWRWIEDKWVADEPEPPPIEALQAQVWEGIKAKRSEQTMGGVLVKSVDKWFHTDETSATAYSTIAGMIALDNYEPVQWKTMDNEWVLLTIPLFKELQTAMSLKTNENYAVAEDHKAAMLLSDEPLEYDYSTNWV